MRDHYPTAGDLRAALQAAGLTVSSALEGQLWAMAPAGVTAFERQVNRKMLAGAASAQLVAPPTNHAGLLRIPDLASLDEANVALLPTVTYTPTGTPTTTWANGTDFLLEPVEAPSRGRPFTRIRFRRHDWRSPGLWTLQRAISITGRWGYGCLLPDDAWLAMLFLGLQSAFETSIYGLRGGLVKWTQQGVTEEYGMGLAKQWQTVIDSAVATYRRLDIG